MVITSFLIILAVLAVEITRLTLIRKKNNKSKTSLQKREKELFYLAYLTEKGVLEQSGVEQAFPAYLNKLKETIGWMYHSFFRLDEETQLLPIRFTGYLPNWYMEELSTKLLVKVGDACVGRAVTTKQPATVNVTSVDPRFQNVTSLSERSGYRSLSCFPVMGSLKNYGGFCAYGQEENIFTMHDTQFLLIVANLYGAILEKKLLSNI